MRLVYLLYKTIHAHTATLARAIQTLEELILSPFGNGPPVPHRLRCNDLDPFPLAGPLSLYVDI